ncbi:hypothetical protein PLICRDRAFT_80884, partial [Plicaturopsis crispa FD-325 SS-3]
LAPCLEHLLPLLVCFLKDSLVTWEHFTSEFATGGDIDITSAEECATAFMPTTNDVNEGALGFFRREARLKPCMTISHLSDQAAFCINNTQAFMDACFEADDHWALIWEARLEDTSGIEAKRTEALVDHARNVVDAKRAKDEE